MARTKKYADVNQAAFAVSSVFGIPVDEMLANRRNTALARQSAAYIALRRTERSYGEIANGLGYYDYSVVAHAESQVEKLKKNSPEFAKRLERCFNAYGTVRGVRVRENGGVKTKRAKQIEGLVKSGLKSSDGHESHKHKDFRDKLYAGRMY